MSLVSFPNDERNGLSVEVFNGHPTTRLRHRPFADDVARVLRDAGLENGTVRILFLDKKEHRALNVEFLGHDYDTDVITFPLEADPLEGEIYVSVEQGRKQADEFEVSYYREWRRLVIHGALHLVGYDDATDEEREAMRELEDHYLEQSG